MSSRSAFAGLILAGGESRRMGVDKAMIEVDGKTMLERVVDAYVAAAADPVVVVGRTAVPSSQASSVVGMADEVADSGPLAGIITGLRFLAASSVPIAVCAPCDLLQPSTELIEASIAALAGCPEVEVVIPMLGDRPQWVQGAWRTTALDHLVARFDSGERSVRRGLDGLDVAFVDLQVPEGHLDADTPDELPPGAQPPRH